LTIKDFLAHHQKVSTLKDKEIEIRVIHSLRGNLKYLYSSKSYALQWRGFLYLQAEFNLGNGKIINGH